MTSNEQNGWEIQARKDFREYIKRWPEMDALGSADFWIERIILLRKEWAGKIRKLSIDMPDHECGDVGYCTHYPITDMREKTLVNVLAIIEPDNK